MPKLCWPIRASPDSLRRTRFQTGPPLIVAVGPGSGALPRGRRHLGREVRLLLLDSLAQLEAGEAAHLDVLADLRHRLVDHLADREVRVLDERLLEQARLAVELLHLALDDLLDHVGRLAGGRSLLAVDRTLVREDLLRDL